MVRAIAPRFSKEGWAFYTASSPVIPLLYRLFKQFVIYFDSFFNKSVKGINYAPGPYKFVFYIIF